MRIDVVTLFADFFAGPLGSGLVGKAIAAGGAEVRTIDPRSYVTDVHRTVDDTPYGGGAGMVMKPEPVAKAIDEAQSRGGGPVVLMSPQGRRLSQADLRRWAGKAHLVLVCGRYEGFDERIRSLVDEEVSLGDFVLTGGEYAALAVIDGVVRLLPGTVGNETSLETDSFEGHLLEHPQYTRPPEFRGEGVPEVLRSGDHGRIAEWRHQQALLRTWARRPDLLEQRGIDQDEHAFLAGLSSARDLSLVVGFDEGPSPASITDLALLAAAYRVGPVYLVGPGVEEALAQASTVEVLRPMTKKEEKRRRKRREPPPCAVVDPRAICRPLVDPSVLTGLRVAVARRGDVPVVAPSALAEPAHLLIGPTGVEPEARLPPFLGASPTRRLPMLSAATVALDRLFGEG